LNQQRFLRSDQVPEIRFHLGLQRKIGGRAARPGQAILNLPPDYLPPAPACLEAFPQDFWLCVAQVMADRAREELDQLGELGLAEPRGVNGYKRVQDLWKFLTSTREERIPDLVGYIGVGTSLRGYRRLHSPDEGFGGLGQLHQAANRGSLCGISGNGRTLREAWIHDNQAQQDRDG